MAELSDLERLTADHIDRMHKVEIEIDGDMIHIMCLDEGQARDLATSVALILADRIASWRRVLAEVPSLEVKAERLAEVFAKKPEGEVEPCSRPSQTSLRISS